MLGFAGVFCWRCSCYTLGPGASGPSPRSADMLRLTSTDVHLWRGGLDVPDRVLSTLMGALSADEQSRAERFAFERDRRRFITCRSMLRAVLATYLDCLPQEITLYYGRHGKPALADAASLRFNVSHSQGLAMVAVCRDREVGIDLEAVRPLPTLLEVAACAFSPAEREALERLAPEDHVAAFFNLWTRKEAFAKATGDGLSCALDHFDVSLGTPAALLRVGNDPQEAERWTLHALTPAPGYVAAVVVEGAVEVVARRTWSAGMCQL